MDLLKQFISLLSTAGSLANPRVFIVTSLPTDVFLSNKFVSSNFNCSFPINGSSERNALTHDKVLEVNHGLVQKCVKAITYARSCQAISVGIIVFTSEEVGVGKAKRISDIMKVHNNNKLPALHYYLDTTKDEIPYDFSRKFIHVELSPDLFSNDLRIFDQLFQVTSFSYYLRKDGTMVSFLSPTKDNLGPVLLIEVPVLVEAKREKDQEIEIEDFPVAILPDREVAFQCFNAIAEKVCPTRFIKMDMDLLHDNQKKFWSLSNHDEKLKVKELSYVNGIFTSKIEIYPDLIIAYAKFF